MVRFLVTMVLALALCGGVAWYCDLLPFGPSASATQLPPGNGKRVVNLDLGNLLYNPTEPLPGEPLRDGLQRGANGRPGKEVIVPDCLIVPRDRQDLASAREGIILIVGKTHDSAHGPAPKGLPTVPLLVEGQKRLLAYTPLEEGQIVQYGDPVMLVDPANALHEWLHKQSKIESVRADIRAAFAITREAQARLERLEALQRINKKGVAAEEWSTAEATRDKAREEEASKREQEKLAILEAHKAKVELEQHWIRSSLPGKSYVKSIEKNVGEGVKSLERVMHLYSLSRLRVEGLLEAPYFEQLEELRKTNKDGIRVVIEPTEELAGKTLPKTHRGEITSVAVSHDPNQPDNPRLVTASEDATINVWRLQHLGRPQVLRHASPVRVVACSPKGAPRSWCLAGCANGTIYLWDLDNPQRPVHKIEGKHLDGVSALAFSSDGAWFASGGNDNTIWLWETKTGQVKYPFDFDHGVADAHQGTITALTFTPQCKLVSAARDKTLRVWTLREKGAALDGDAISGRGGNVTAPGVSADGRMMVFDQGRTLQVLSVGDHGPLCTLDNVAATPFETLALFSPDGNLMLTAGAAEGRMQLWRSPVPAGGIDGKNKDEPGARGYELRELVTRERSAVTCAAFSPDGTFAVSGTKDGYVYLWQMPSREAIKTHRLQTDSSGKLLTLTHFDRALDANKMRISVNLENPETPEYPDGRLIPGRRVTIVIDP